MQDETKPYPKCFKCAADVQPQHRFCHNCGNTLRPSLLSGLDGETIAMPRWSPALRVGDFFADRFLVERELGSGGMGVVYQIHDQSTNLKLAIKVLKPEFSRDAAATIRFEREIRILARLRHPSIPRVVEWGIHNDSLFFISELIEGEDVGQILIRKKRLPLEEALPILLATAEALASAHQAGIVHRDIKPTNVMVSNDGRVFVIDFGVARSTSAEITRLTETGLFIGTPQYMSPEQLDSHRADERSDIYSLGVLFFEILTGTLPFHGDSPIAIAAKHIRELPPSPRAVTSAIPFWMELVILRCLEKDPALRYWTISELLADLRKNHDGKSSRKSTFPNGDIVVEDPAGSRGWVLAIWTATERSSWTGEICLYFRDSYYKLRTQWAPAPSRKHWEYRFEYWPEAEVMRRIVDYETEAMMEASAPSMFSRAKNLLGLKKK